MRSITRPGIVTIYVDLDGAFPPEDVGDVWQEVRNGVGDIRHTLPQGVLGPFFNDDFGDVFGIIYGFTADGFTHRELRDYVDDVRTALIRDVDLIGKVEFIGAQDEEVVVELRPDQRGCNAARLWSGLRRDRSAERGATVGTINSGLENLSLRVSGSFEHETDILDVPSECWRPHDPPRRRSRSQARASSIRRRRSIASMANPRSALASPCERAATSSSLGRQVSASVNRSIGNLPIGINTVLVSNQPDVVNVAIGDFTTSLYQAVGIILVVSFVTLGVRPGRSGRHRYPCHPCDRLSCHAGDGNRSAPGLAGGADHRSGPAC